MIKNVEKMAEKAGKSEDSNDALKFSQAALNTANALKSVHNYELDEEARKK